MMYEGRVLHVQEPGLMCRPKLLNAARRNEVMEA